MATFTVRIGGENADLATDTAFDLELLNSMLDIDTPQSSRALGITLPFTPTNNDLMGHIYHPQSATTQRNYATELYLDTNLVDWGYSYLKDAKANYPLDFTSNIKEFFGAYQARLISDIDLGSFALPTSLNDTLLSTWQTQNGCVFPTIRNDVYYEKNVPSTFDGLVNKYSAGYVASSPKTPMFFVKYVLQKIGDLAGVTYAGEFWDDAATAKLILYNTREAVGTVERRLFMPNMTIAQLIVGLRKTFNLYLRFDVYRKVLRMDYAKSVHNGSCTIDWSRSSPKFKGGSPINIPGLELSWTLDTNDQLHKEAFFLPYATIDAVGQRQAVVSPFRTLLMENSLPKTSQFGAAVTQLDKKCIPGLLSWQGLVSGVPLATNQFGTTTLQWSDIRTAFWLEEERFRMGSFRVEDRIVLTSAQISQISAILRGEDSSWPIVHINGVNYLIERLVIPSGSANTPLMSAWRI